MPLERTQRTLAVAGHESDTLGGQDGDRPAQKSATAPCERADPHVAEASELAQCDCGVTGAQCRGGARKWRVRLGRSLFSARVVRTREPLGALLDSLEHLALHDE